MRIRLHYLFSVLILTSYGGRVCPYLESLDIWHWLVQLSIVFGLAFGLRCLLLERLVLSAPYEDQTRRQFFFDLAAFVAVGLATLIYNVIMHHFPAGSGVKVVLGTTTLGLFAALDASMERERAILRQLSRVPQAPISGQRYFPLTHKMAMGAILCVVSVTAVIFLVMAKDIDWLIDRGAAVTREAKLSILKELGFIMAVYLAEIVNVVLAYSKNLKLLLGNENSALEAVANGDLQAFAAVAPTGEFSVMAGYTNHMIEVLRLRTDELERTQEATIESLATLAEYRDPETGGHIKRTKNYVRLLGEKLKDHPRFRDVLDDKAVKSLYRSAPLHDIGKVGVQDHILLKPGKLSDEEFEEMKKHTTYGRDTLRVASKSLGDSSFLRYATEIAYTHQEKWDGSGYPQGLRGEDIPVSGRLMAVADVYDALISRRVYKPPFPHSQAVGIITQGKGAHFDPDIVEAFLELAEKFREVALTFADFDEERETLKL